MPDREKVISEFEDFVKSFSKRNDTYYKGLFVSVLDLLKEQQDEIYALQVELASADELAEGYAELLKEQEKKQITLQKKHVITWSRNDELSMKKLYEAICETLLDEGELFIERTDDNEKVELVFYVAEGR